MIEKMEKIYLYSLRDQTGAIMEELLKSGAVQQVQAKSMLTDDTAATLLPGETPDLSQEERMLAQLQESISVLKGFGKSRGLFEKRSVKTYEELTDERVWMDAMKTCREMEVITGDLNALERELKTAEFQQAALTPWKSFDLPVEQMETETCKIRCYALRKPEDPESVKTAAAEQGLELYLQEICEEKEAHYIAILFRKKDEKLLQETLGASGAAEASTEGMAGTFHENYMQCRQAILELRKKTEENREKLHEMADRRSKLELASDALRVRIRCLSGQEKFLHTDQVDLITGWIPTSRKAEVIRRLDRYGCYCEFKKPEKGEDYPVLMKNSKLVEPFGTITEMYSLPDSHSIDTNWAVGFFFFVFFGMMLSDAGYGLVLLIGGLLGAKFLDVGEQMKRMMKMIGICGISTMFWGALYGSWFGDAIPKIAETFFGTTIHIPKFIDPLTEPMKILILSCAFGAVHLFIGMGIKGYIMIKRGDLWGAVFDVGFWYILLIGLPFLLAPEPWGTAGKIMSLAGAAGLVLTQGRSKPTILGKLTSGVISLYGVTGYFSDILSYSRILALGLATGVVGSVVNIMGTLTGGNIWGAILFLMIFAAGHLLNLGINALGAYVHSARLQYVEFFGKYYESGGHKFDPLRIETEYVKVTEEE